MTATSDRPWLTSYSHGVPAVIEVPDEPLTAGLARTVARHPDRVAIVFEGRTTTYRKLARESQLFNAMNLFGSCLLTWTAVVNRQYGFILLEGAWALLSLPGTLRPQRQK